MIAYLPADSDTTEGVSYQFMTGGLTCSVGDASPSLKKTQLSVWKKKWKKEEKSKIYSCQYDIVYCPMLTQSITVGIQSKGLPSF